MRKNKKNQEKKNKKSNLPKKEQELFFQRGKLLLAPPGLNAKTHACESKNFPRRHGVARGKNISCDPSLKQ